VKKKAQKKTKKLSTGTKKAGRPTGSRNRDKTQVVWTPELRLIHNMIQKQLCLVGQRLTITHLLLDGKFGHNNAVQMALGCGLELVSKLRHDAALYFPYDGPFSGHGPYRKYGDKINYAAILVFIAKLHNERPRCSFGEMQIKSKPQEAHFNASR
jgi:hypothetical protein